MIRVKICGIRSEEDVMILNRHMPDYAGFVFAAGKRSVSPGRAARLINMLDARIRTVGVFVNSDLPDVVDISRQCGLDVVQLHGEETPEYVCALKRAMGGREYWKAFRISGEDSFADVRLFSATAAVDAIVLDSYCEGCHGGSGKTFDWGLAANQTRQGTAADCKIVLAGGLNPVNVGGAIRSIGPFCPYAVDVSSGVEIDGRKDECKIMDFIVSVREGAFFGNDA